MRDTASLKIGQSVSQKIENKIAKKFKAAVTSKEKIMEKSFGRIWKSPTIFQRYFNSCLHDFPLG